MGNTTRQGMKFGLILLLLLAGVVLGIRMLLSREGGRPRYTDMPQLLALCDSKNAPAVKRLCCIRTRGRSATKKRRSCMSCWSAMRTRPSCAKR